MQKDHAIHNAYQFVARYLIDNDGLVESYPYQAEKIPGRPDYKREALSETVGLWLQVLFSLNDRKAFNQQVGVLQERFILPNGTVSWRLERNADGAWTQDPHSASIDDLRIIRALLEAANHWGVPDYEKLALQIAQALKERSVFQDFLLHQPLPDNPDHDVKIVILSYLDLKALQLLALKDPDWDPIYKRSKALLIKGMKENGLFYDRYQVEENKYFDEENNFINQVMCAQSLAEVGFSSETFLGLLRAKWLRHAIIHGKYDYESMKPLVSYESTAVYALIGQLAWAMADKTFYENLKEKIVTVAGKQNNALWQGSLCESTCHSFDHLHAMLTIIQAGVEHDPK